MAEEKDTLGQQDYALALFLCTSLRYGVSNCQKHHASTEGPLI